MKEEMILIPGTGQSIKNYNYPGLDIWITDEIKFPRNTKCFIGHSLGASFILKSNVNRKCKFVFINPLIKKRYFFIHFINWLRFIIFEGFLIKKAVPIKYWWHNFRQVWLLLKVNVLEELKNIPKENLVIIRGIKDNYFCDTDSVGILKKNNFKVIEVNAGHDWNKNIAKTIEELMILI